MRRILVTGANKGIGLAIVEAILGAHDDTFVYLGSRDRARGQAAAERLIASRTAWRARLEVVPLDVAGDGSVAEAASFVNAHAGATGLYGLVNNAGIMDNAKVAEVLDVNTVGVHRVCEAFAPLVQAGGRIVNVTSASGPSYVATCSAEMQRFFLDVDRTISWPELKAFIDACGRDEGDPRAFRAKGLADGAAYGLSKACTNLLTLLVARERPNLRVNACTPGFIETDMTRHYAKSQNKTPAELGMKPPAAGTKAPMFLLFEEPVATGRYYGSDAMRSPLDRYRAPGSPAFTGD